MQGLIDGRIDIGVMYTPQRRPNLQMTALMDERLVLVESTASGSSAVDYVHVAWGPEFYAQPRAPYPDLPGPSLSAHLGWPGLPHLLACGRSGHFPLPPRPPPPPPPPQSDV